MKYLVTIILTFLFVTSLSYTTIEEEKITLCNEGICVVQFNAKFNAANEVTWLNELTDCSTSTVDIMADPSLPQDYKIVVVPTILTTREEVQESIDNIIMSKF